MKRLKPRFGSIQYDKPKNFYHGNGPQVVTRLWTEGSFTEETRSKEKNSYQDSVEPSVRVLRALRGKFLTFLVLLFFIFIFLVSCATAPKASFSGEDSGNELSLLPAGARLYLWADTVRGRPLLDAFFFEGRSGKDAEQILDNTRSAAVAVFSNGEAQGRRFFAAASGNYPGFRANFSFVFSRSWKKQKSPTGSSYWYSRDEDLALALGSNLALVSNIDPFENFPVEGPPDGFAGFRRGLVMAGWMNDPSELINTFLSSMGIPLQIPAEEFFFGAERTTAAAAPWDLVFKIRTPSAIQARSLLSLFSIARFFVSQGADLRGKTNEDAIFMDPREAAALLFANVPEQDEEYLSLRIGSLTERRVALLFNLFSLYSN